MTKPPEHDLDFLPPRAAALFRVGHKKSYLAQKIVFIFLIIFIVWAHYSTLHEVTKGTGKIVSAKHMQTLNNLEGGIIRQILVKEGQFVQQGQVLIRLDPTIFRAKFSQDIENYYRLLGAAERLRAQIANQNTFIPSPDLARNAPAIAQQEQARMLSHNAKVQNEINIANKEVVIKQQEIVETQTKLKDIQLQYQYISKQIQITKPLADKKIYPELDFIKLNRELVEQQSQIKVLTVALNRQFTALKQAQDRLSQIVLRFRNEDMQELHDVEARLAEARGAELMDRDRLMRTEIRAPITGIVRDIKVETIGGVVQPGEAILDVVPFNDNLLVEAQISPSDIGFIRVGMPATIKVTAFDFSSYGGLNAYIEEISPDTITDKREVTYYRVMLQTTSNTLIKDGKRHTIMPGMQVEVDILTGEKSILKYLVKPFTRALKNAMTER